MTDPCPGGAGPGLPPSRFGAGFTLGENDLTPPVAPPSYPAPPPYPGAVNDGLSPPGYLPPAGHRGGYLPSAGPPPPPMSYPGVVPAVPYPGYPVPQMWAPRPGVTNSMAIAAFVCAFLVAPLGIVFGHIALSQINRTGEDGHGLAIAGLVIGYFWTGLLLLWLIAIVG